MVITEEHARKMQICPVCNIQTKTIGQIVCWDCRHEYKHFEGTLQEYIDACKEE